MAHWRPLRRIALGGWLAAFLLVAGPLAAQEQFFTQSGGRGIENAKTNARLTKTEKDVDALNVEVAKIKPHAKIDIPSCTDTGAKLRWSGTAWSCDNETDPTVKGWAKKDLPTCGANQLLSVSSDGFGCRDSAYLSNETDPTVQNWAKTALPSCNSGESLTVGAGGFTCKVDEKGITAESDPLVYDFAHTDRATITDCNAAQKLTMNGSRLVCSVDAVGITSETDPLVQDFARKDVSGSVLSACAAGQVLTTYTSGGKILLKCANDAGGSAAALNLADLGDVNVAAKASGTALIYSAATSKWEAAAPYDSTVQNWARSNLGACSNGDVLTYNGSSLACGAASSLISSSLATLSDVSITAPVANNILKYTGTRWVNSNSATLVSLVATSIGVGDLAASGAITAPVIATSASLVQGNQTVTGNLTVGGNLYVSGAQIFDGVTFANGGVSATGTISATRFSGDGSGLTGIVATSADWYGLTHVPAVLQNISNSTGSVTATSVYVSNATVDNDLRVRGNLYVSGSQQFDGVTFANGGVSATGTISATRFVGDGSGLTGVNDWYALAHIPTVLQNISNSTGSVTATSIYVSNATVDSDLRVRGNLYVSGSQSIDGVTFANGGVSATGTISATYFAGDGSGLTGVTANGMSWYGLTRIPTQVTAVSDSGSIGMAEVSATRLYGGSVSGSTGTFGSIGVGGIAMTGNLTGTPLISTSAAGVVSADAIYARNISGSTIRGTFLGDGSGLTGVVAASGDRIVSGTTSMVAYTGTGVISVTQAGTNTAYFHPSLGLVTIGVSSTGPISGTSGYFSDNVTALTSMGVSSGPVLIVSSGVPLIRGWAGNTTGLSLAATSGAPEAMRIVSSGYVGIGTTNPTTKLEVNGTISATNFVGDGSGLTNINANAVAGLNADRITSGTASLTAISATGLISVTQGGVTTAYFHPTFGLVTVGISSTGVVSATGLYSNADAAISGTVRMSGTGSETCDASAYGTLRYVNLGGGNYGMQLCRP